MESPRGQTVLLTLITAWCVPHVTGQYDLERVRLADVPNFAVQRGSYTTARRGSPILQMKCVGGSAGCKYEPPSMQCFNRGWDGRSILWECKADFDERVNFGSMHVSCEGFSRPGDEYILTGSCGVEYTLDWNRMRSPPVSDQNARRYDVWEKVLPNSSRRAVPWF